MSEKHRENRSRARALDCFEQCCTRRPIALHGPSPRRLCLMCGRAYDTEGQQIENLEWIRNDDGTFTNVEWKKG